MSTLQQHHNNDIGQIQGCFKFRANTDMHFVYLHPICTLRYYITASVYWVCFWFKITPSDNVTYKAYQPHEQISPGMDLWLQISPGLIWLVKWILFELVFPIRLNKINWRLYTCDHVVTRLVAIKLGVVWEGGGVCVCVCVWGGGGGSDSGFTKIVHNIYVFATGKLVAPPDGP